MDWNRRCVGLEAMAALHLFGAAGRSVPKLGRVDLAAVMFSRQKLATESIRFGTLLVVFFSTVVVVTVVAHSHPRPQTHISDCLFIVTLSLTTVAQGTFPTRRSSSA
jgi:hypothetical protein